ncbi:hypothetical protein FDX19_13625 [Citrobacter sp. wls619]|uniref:PIN domain-containing protein n=1 Tax=Citrobacter sp. wls619 TaxID=2576432 RepID=UPI0010C9E2B6|nr:hypothetical protein [Citrobacter sp. wls619]TKV08988.1 hypothetical protein FDX19_13625 [Citrobacter sp. wls619]
MDTYNSSHTGSGDIVNGPKIVHNHYPPEFTADNIYRYAEDIFRDLRNNDITAAKIVIQTLNKSPATDLAKKIIDTLNIAILHSEGQSTTLQNSLLFDLAKNNELSEKIKDIVFAIIILTEQQSKSVSQLNSIYNSSPKQKYSNLFFYQFIANNTEITDYWNSNKELFGEDDLYCLSRGSSRENNWALAKEIADDLNHKFPSINNQIFSIYIQVTELATVYKDKDIFSLNKDIYDGIYHNSADILRLFNDYADNRYLLCGLANLISLTRTNDVQLIHLAMKHKEELSKIHPDMAVFINSIIPVDDKSIKKELNRIDPIRGLAREQLIVLLEAKDRGIYIKDNLRKKIIDFDLKENISNENLEFSFQFITLKAKLLTNEKSDFLYKIKLKAELKLLLALSDIYKVSSSAIINLCQHLTYIGLATESYQFAEIHLPKILWPSPLVLTYFDSLIFAEQLSVLSQCLEKIEKKYWNCQIWFYQAKLYYAEYRWESAQHALEKSIELNPLFIEAWSVLIQCVYKIDASSTPKILSKIPREVFHSLDESMHLLFTIANLIDYHYAENILAEFFITNPKKYASSILRLHFSAQLQKSIAVKEIKNPYSIVNIIRAIKLKKNDRTQEIIIADIAPENEQEALISIYSSYGELLKELIIGEKKRYSLDEIEVIEDIDPYAAIFRYALKITNEHPDETFPIKAIEIPSDPEKMLDKLKDELLKFSHNETIESIINNDHLPLYIKGKEINKSNPVKIAIQLLEDPAIAKSLAFPTGSIENTNSILTDIYGLVYLALMQLDAGIQRNSIKIHITPETHYYIHQWLQHLENPEYLSIGVQEDSLYKITAKDIQKQTELTRHSLTNLLNHCEIKTIPIQDTPNHLNEMRDFLDNSVYSTMKYALSTSTPYFITDNYLSIFINKVKPNTTILNSSAFISNLLSTMQLDEKKHAYAKHIFTYLPIPISYNDTIELAHSGKKEHIILSIELLKRYGHTFHNYDSLSKFLVITLTTPLLKMYLNIQNNNITEQPSFNDSITLLFNTCCQLIIDQSDNRFAEDKIVDFTKKLISNPILSQHPQYIRYIFTLFSSFIWGHFLDIDYMNSLLK